MAELGHFALLLSLFLSGYAVLADLLGAWRKDLGSMGSGRNATIASLACLTVSMATLWLLLVGGDFGVSYVADHTSRDLPIVYRISALWAGAGGSLLLWLWLQVGFVVLVFCRLDASKRIFGAAARAAANFVSVFFLMVLVLDKNPFALSVVVPVDGGGLNPLLQHPAMALHPPTLFIGYAAFAIPFAWAFTLLKGHGDQGAELFKQVRNWILWAWLFLTIGIVLGSWWAYEELGWGGYWAWDPVENSSLMPWLIATALLHCSRMYKPRTSIAVWLLVLCLATFSLCIFGTFLTRYGLVSSVHAFPEPGLGILFLVLLAHIWVIAVVLMWRSYRLGSLKVDSSGSGLRFIIYNNWVMLLLTFVIFVGTLFPFFSGLFTEQKISLKPDYFTKITAPGGLVLLLLLCVCPYLIRYGIGKNWRTIGGIIVAVAALVSWFIMHKLPLAFFIICGFGMVNLAADFISRYIKSRDREKKSTAPLNLRWYGARIVHIGVVLCFIGIAGSGGYDTEKQAALKRDEKINVAGFDITFNGLRADHGSTFTSVTADLSVHKNDKLVAELHPSQAYYSRSDKRTSEVDIRRTLASDLYVALTQVDNSNELINLNILVKPLINWIWIGSIVSVLGTILVLISFYRRRTTVLQSEEKDV
ncbi:MAG: heme lyase CcmF/NrfE family subunit [Planctomycetota bacterium]|jgi:cytochrome c-type biogenesis protein CcmF